MLFYVAYKSDIPWRLIVRESDPWGGGQKYESRKNEDGYHLRPKHDPWAQTVGG